MHDRYVADARRTWSLVSGTDMTLAVSVVTWEYF